MIDEEWLAAVVGKEAAAAVVEAASGWDGSHGSEWRFREWVLRMGRMGGPYLEVVSGVWDDDVRRTDAGAVRPDSVAAAVRCVEGVATPDDWAGPLSEPAAAAVGLTVGGWPSGWAERVLAAACDVLPDGPVLWRNRAGEAAALGVVRVCRHACLDGRELAVLAGGPEPARLAAARHPMLTEALAGRLAVDAVPGVRAAVAKNAAAPEAARAVAALS